MLFEFFVTTYIFSSKILAIYTTAKFDFYSLITAIIMRETLFAEFPSMMIFKFQRLYAVLARLYRR